MKKNDLRPAAYQVGRVVDGLNAQGGVLTEVFDAREQPVPDDYTGLFILGAGLFRQEAVVKPEDLITWWEAEGRPAPSQMPQPVDWAGIIEWLQATTVDLWRAGAKAPYDLFFVNGRVVEAVAGDYQPNIRRGNEIPTGVAQMIERLVYPRPPDPVKIGLLQDGLDAGPGVEDLREVPKPGFVGQYVDADGWWQQDRTPAPLLLSEVKL